MTQKQTVFNLIEEYGILSSKDIVEESGIKDTNVRHYIRLLRKEGRVELSGVTQETVTHHLHHGSDAEIPHNLNLYMVK